jgi:hypothetical protein
LLYFSPRAIQLSMVIQSYSSANQPFANNAVNPAFFGAKSQPGTIPPKSVQVQPPPYQTTVQPPPFQTTVGGVPITVTPGPIQVTVPVPVQTVALPSQGSSSVVRNQYESVGLVAGNPPKLCCLVRPNVVAAAQHYALQPGDTISFFGPNGVETATVKGVALTFGDLELYYLNAPVTSVNYALITSSLATQAYAGMSAISFGLVGSRQNAPYNWIPAATQSLISRVIPGTGGVWDATISAQPPGSYLEYGDSGSPNFITLGGQVYFIGTDRKVGSMLDVNMISPVVSQVNSL